MQPTLSLFWPTHQIANFEPFGSFEEPKASSDEVQKLGVGNIEFLSGKIVAHSAFSSAVQRIERCFHPEDRIPVCMAIVGESGTGKTSVLKAVSKKHPNKQSSNGFFVPIIQITAPPKPSVKGVCEEILHAFGDPYSDAGTVLNKTERIKSLWKHYHCRVLMLDQFQHFVDKSTWLVQPYVADWLTALVEELSCALVVAGLPSCMAVINQNEQLARLFLSPVEMPRFLWNSPNQRGEFKLVLWNFHQALAKMFDLPAFHSDEMAFRWFCATGGVIGYVTKILREAIVAAQAAQRSKITMHDLDEAHGQALWSVSNPETPRPFRADFVSAPTDELMLKVARIGKAVDCTQLPRAQPRKFPRTSASQVLMAA